MKNYISKPKKLLAILATGLGLASTSLVHGQITRKCDASFTDLSKIIASPGSAVLSENLAVLAANNKNYESYVWKLGDGTQDTGQTVRHQYKQAGNYSVTLTIRNKKCTDEKTQVIQIGEIKKTCDATFNTYDAENAPLSRTFKARNGGYSYKWDFGDGSTGVGMQINHFYAQSGKYKVTLSIIENLGDTVRSCRDQKSQIIEVVGNKPTCKALITKSIDKFTVHFFDSIQSSIPAGYSSRLIWDFGDGARGEGFYTSHTYAKPGSYNVTLVKSIYQNPCFPDTLCKPTLVCEEKHSTLVEIKNEVPNCNASIETYVNANTVTFLDKIVHYPLVADGITEYRTWYFGDGSKAEGQKLDHTYSQPGIYQVTLVKTVYYNSCYPCKRAPVQVCQEKFTTTVEIKSQNNRCAAQIETYVNNSTVTFQDKLVYLPLIADGTFETRIWYFGDGTQAEGQKLDHTYSAPGVYNVTLVKSVFKNPCFGDTLNCKALPYLICQEKHNVTVVIENNETRCRSAINSYISNNTVTLWDTLARENAGDSIVTLYEWHFGDGTIGTGPKQTHTYQNSGSYPVTLLKSVYKNPFNVNNDTNRVLVCSEKATTIVTILPVQDTLLCQARIHQFVNGFNVSLADRHYLDTTGYAYKVYDELVWNFGDGTVVNGRLYHINHTYVKPGVYNVTLTKTISGTPCAKGSICPQVIQTICSQTYSFQVVIEDPAAGLCKAAVTSSVNNLELTVTDNNVYQPIRYDGIFINYLWNFGDNDSAFTSKAVHQYQQPGKYHVTLVKTALQDPCLPDSNGVKCAALPYLLCSEFYAFDVIIGDTLRPSCKPTFQLFSEGNKVTVTATVPPNVGYAVVNFGDGDIAEVEGARTLKITHTYTTKALYQICVRYATVSDAQLPYVKLASYCSEEVCQEITGKQDTLVTDTIPSKIKDVLTSLFPSPAGETLNIGIENSLEELTLRLFDISGNLKKEVPNLTSGIKEIDTKGLDNGLYFFTFSAGNKIIHKGKITVSK